MRKSRGFSLIEVMIALALAGISSAFLLIVTRSQLKAFQMNEQLQDAQLNARAGVEFIEGTLRRACGGIAYGQVGLNVSGVTPQVANCVRVFDGDEGNTNYTGGSFSTSTGVPASQSDAIEIVYGTAPITNIAQAASLGGNTVGVCDNSNFKVNDLVLITNMSQAVMVQLSDVNGTAPTSCLPTTSYPNAHTLTFNLALPSTGAGASLPQGQTGPNVTAFDPTASGNMLMKAVSVSIYRFNSSTTNPNNRMLMLDPAGMVDTNSHNNDQPLVEGVENFEIAIGSDTGATPDGIITEVGSAANDDEWLGNYSGELPSPATPIYFNVGTSGGTLYRQIRATLVVRTNNLYPGNAALGVTKPVEDRTNNINLTPNTAGGAPRYRTMRVSVAPRVWNLLN
jgi:prepilin-type N-terminal cleavage/methylation domain-containing protein